MKNNLHQASDQWAMRPSDERFWTVDELLAATLAHREAAFNGTIDNADLRVDAEDGKIAVVGKNHRAQLTSWAFTQLAARAEAPASYLRSLPATLAAQNLNYGLKAHTDPNGRTALLVHRTESVMQVRAALTESYTRVWNYQIAERLLALQDNGWKVPPGRPATKDTTNTRRATAADAALSLTVQEGDVIGPSGLYAGFEDMFAFMVHPDRVIDDGSANGLMRGFFVWNSEVGKSSFGVSQFLFRGVCGNHIVWDATGVSELRVRHVGDADSRVFSQIAVQLRKYADESAAGTERKIKIAREFILAVEPQEVLDMVFRKQIMSRKTAEAAMAAVVPDVDGDPCTAWGFAQGVTRLSQVEGNADRRVMLDRAAGRVIELAF
jgi:hypothetical protein